MICFDKKSKMVFNLSHSNMIIQRLHKPMREVTDIEVLMEIISEQSQPFTHIIKYLHLSKITKKIILLISSLFLGFYSLTAQNIIVESIMYLKPDGKSYTNYRSIKSSDSSSYTLIPKGKNPFDYYQYLFPNSYRFEKTKNKNFNKVHFDKGSFSMIVEDVFDKEDLSIDEKDVYTYRTQNKEINWNYGLHWNNPDRSKIIELAYTWIIPEQIEFVNFEVNQQGYWVKRNNSLSFFGSIIMIPNNNVLFEIKYKKRSNTPKDFKIER